MSSQDQIRNFEYRPYRLQAGFAVQFFIGELPLNGMCRDVSDAGIRAELNGSLAVGDSGLLVLLHPSGKLSLRAKVAYIETYQVGLVFVFEMERERQFTIDYIAAIRSYSVNSQLIEFP